MADLTSLASQLQATYRQAEAEGYVQTHVEGVCFFWATESRDICPHIYDPGIVFLLQGHKLGFIDDDTFRYDADNYLIISVPVPFRTMTEATPESPVLGLFVSIDLPQLTELVALASKHGGIRPCDGTLMWRGVEPVPLDEDMRTALGGLVKCLCSPSEGEALGSARVREVVYRAVLGKQGPSLQALTQHDAQYARIARCMGRIHRDYTQALGVQDLAAEAGMSVSAFHRAFKQVTGNSPLQYIKSIRLHRAQWLMTRDKIGVAEAAFEVGYESPTQFSREFKRYFNMTPSQARKLDPTAALVESLR